MRMMFKAQSAALAFALVVGVAVVFASAFQTRTTRGATSNAANGGGGGSGGAPVEPRQPPPPPIDTLGSQLEQEMFNDIDYIGALLRVNLRSHDEPMDEIVTQLMVHKLHLAPSATRADFERLYAQVLVVPCELLVALYERNRAYLDSIRDDHSLEPITHVPCVAAQCALLASERFKSAVFERIATATSSPETRRGPRHL